MNSVFPWLRPTIRYALYFGLFVLVAGFFISPENSKYQTQIYIGLYIPAVAALILNAPSLARALARDVVLQCFTLLLIWLGITIFWTPFDNPVRILKVLGMIWVFVLAIRLMLDDMRLFNITLSLSLCVAAVVVLWTVVDFLRLNGPGFYTQRLWQLGGRYMSAVVVGEIVAVFMMYCLMQARLVAKPWPRAFYLVLALIFFLPLVLSFSRTAFLALSLTALWYYLQRRNTRIVLLLAGFSVLLFAVMLLDIESEWLANVSRSWTFEMRMWGWRATMDQIRENWLIGHGVRAPFYVSFEGTPFAGLGEPFYHPHNLLISIWYEAGLVGVALAISLLVLMVLKLRPLLANQEVLYWSCIFVFVQLACLVDSPAIIDRPAEPWLWFWLPLAMAVNADKIAEYSSRNRLGGTDPERSVRA